MKISGKVLNVQDGDAIIIHAEKNKKDLLIVIDGGEGHGTEVCNTVDAYCKQLKKEAPDLIVCTHFDEDHISGVIDLIEKYQSKIKMIWIHQPVAVVKELFESAGPVLERIYNKNMNIKLNEFALHQNYMVSENHEKFRVILEKIKKIELLFKSIEKYKIPTTQPFAEQCAINGWEEIKVIGPTEEYYNKVFKKANTILEFFTEEYEGMLLEQKRVVAYKPSDDPCAILKTYSAITPTNKASVIISFECEDGKYLFTGDAGIESMKQTIGYPDYIRNLKFLKIPHHGSNNNMSKELVDIMKPKIAYNTGARHQDQEVIDCIAKVPGITVKTTKRDGDLTF